MDEEKLNKSEVPSGEKSHGTYVHITASSEDITIFDPRGVEDYKRAYPELSNVEEFSNINVSDLKFVWWYANPTSPLVKTQHNPAKRANAAFGKVWGFKDMDKTKLNSYCSLRFPEPLRLAIERMSKFDYNARFRAKAIADKSFSDCESVSRLQPTDFLDKDGNVDYTKFLSTKKMVVNMMPELLKIKEEGFGISDKKKKKNDDTEGTDLMNEFLEEQ